MLDITIPYQMLTSPERLRGSTAWKRKCLNTNVSRTLLLFSEEGKGLAGPFLVDIDSSEYEHDAQGHREDLEQALAVARLVGSLLKNRWGVIHADLRLFFSRRNRFNFEVRPTALGITGDVNAQMQGSERLQHELRDELKANGFANYVERVYGQK